MTDDWSLITLFSDPLSAYQFQRPSGFVQNGSFRTDFEAAQAANTLPVIEKQGLVFPGQRFGGTDLRTSIATLTNVLIDHGLGGQCVL